MAKIILTQITFAPETNFTNEIKNNSPDYENDFLGGLIREQFVELGELDCLPIG